MVPHLIILVVAVVEVMHLQPEVAEELVVAVEEMFVLQGQLEQVVEQQEMQAQVAQ